MQPKGWLPWVRERRATAKERRRKCSSRSDPPLIARSWSMPRHMPADHGEIGFAGPRFIHEFAVEHHHQPIGEFKDFVEVLAHQQRGGTADSRGHDLGM